MVDIELGRLVTVARGRSEDAPNAAADFDDISELKPTQVEKYNALVAGIEDLRAEGGYDAVTIKCWGAMNCWSLPTARLWASASAC